jgi:hypothetical protein
MASAASADRSIVTGLFRDSAAVERAYEIAVDQGYGIDDVNVVMSDDTRRRYYSDDRPVDTDLAKKTKEGGELGGPTGGRAGLAISIVAAVGAALAVPGLGFVMAGPIAVALAGAGAAGLAAGLIGALADWGLPEARVRAYEADIRDGAILVAVKTKSPEDGGRIAERWRALGGRDVYP